MSLSDPLREIYLIKKVIAADSDCQSILAQLLELQQTFKPHADALGELIADYQIKSQDLERVEEQFAKLKPGSKEAVTVKAKLLRQSEAKELAAKLLKAEHRNVTADRKPAESKGRELLNRLALRITTLIDLKKITPEEGQTHIDRIIQLIRGTNHFSF